MAAEMIAVADSLKDLRKARKMTQTQLADALGIGQVAIAQLEQRSDLLLSTLQRYVEAAGGRLYLFVTMKNGRSFLLDRIGERNDLSRAGTSAKAQRRRRKSVETVT
jgi:transcriptional regulator with XRE-family HTH domain